MVEDAMQIAPCWVTRSEAVRSRVKNFSHLNQDGCFGTLSWEAYLDRSNPRRGACNRSWADGCGSDARILAARARARPSGRGALA